MSKNRSGFLEGRLFSSQSELAGLLKRHFFSGHVNRVYVYTSDVARPLCYKTNTTYIFKTKTSKNIPLRKNQASYAGNRKKPAYYRLSSQVLLHPKIRIFQI